MINSTCLENVSIKSNSLGGSKLRTHIGLIFLVSVAALSVCGANAIGQVDVEETWIEIPTYYLGPDDPNPPLWNEKVYPYPMQTDLGDGIEAKKHRVIIMENKYLKILILPDLGGRILTALDKTNDDFDFIYYNHVIKPGLIALRGAWISGGIEWNFPTLGHTVDTFSPVNYKIIRNSDGSATCVVGSEEWVRRMKWEVFITLPADKSRFRTTARLYNRTLTHNNGYFWSNAAAHAWDDTRVTFPPTSYTYFGKRRNPLDWPIRDGVDVSWYVNTARSSDFFCGAPGDYHGSYNYERDNGTVHCANAYESPGKKFWTWGNSPRGKLWETLLTDSDGQYIELQGGRLLTQGDTWIFEPHLVEQFDEYWYPIKGMKGFVKANPDAALNLQVRDGMIFFAVNTTRDLSGGRIVLSGDGAELLSRQVDLSPEKGFAEEIPDSFNAATYQLRLFDSGGAEVISYSTAKPDIPSPELQPDIYSDPSESAEADFLRGYYSLKDWNRERAVHFFEKALEKDPGFTLAHTWLGITLFKTGRVEKALGHFNKSLARNEDDYTARYYRALCKLRLGMTERTEEDLHKVSRRAAYRHIAPYLLAGIEIGKGDFEKAAGLLAFSLKANPDDLLAKVMLAVVSNALGEPGAADKLLGEVLAADPINSPALIATRLISGKADLDILRGDPQAYLETSILFAQMNLFEQSVGALTLYDSLADSKPHPLVFYYLWYYKEKLGDIDAAESNYERALACDPDYIFPFRTETESVLKQVLDRRPDDWKAHYYLGNLLSANLRWREGLGHFEQAAQQKPAFSVLYRNLGQIYWKKLKDLERAQKMYQLAIGFSPDDYRLYVDLDELYFLSGSAIDRDELHRNVPEKVRSKVPYILALAQYLMDCGCYAKALDTLGTATFKPWEGDRGLPRRVYLISLLSSADKHLNAGDYKAAVALIRKAMEYPENLGTERPIAPVFTREYFLLGQSHRLAGEDSKAKEYFEKATEEETVFLSQQTYYKALALSELGRVKESGLLASDALMECERLLDKLEGPNNSEYLMLAGLFQTALGNKEEGERLLEESLKADPSNRWAIFHLNKLKRDE